jgi:sortase A
MRRWFQRFLLLAGIAGLGVWFGQKLVFTFWQALENRIFDQEIREEPAKTSRPSIRDGSVIGRLTIPRLQLSAMVREGVRENTLSLALGHVPSTAVPGQKGNVAVAGHRDTIFRGLRGIQKYDLIRFETSSSNYVYQVSSIEIVEPTDVSVLRSGRDSELTLVTCYPFYYIGAAPERFIVKAREVDRQPRGVEGQQITFRR